MKNQTQLELMIIIVERGYADKIVDAINLFGHFPSIIRSKGTAPNEILSALGIGEPYKDMIFCFCERKNVGLVYDILNNQFAMQEKKLGIALTIPVSAVGGNVSLQILLGKTRNLF